jgi:hypothetical protein
MKKIVILFLIGLTVLNSYSQKNPVAEITKAVRTSEAEAHLQFLSADEMRGRDTGSPELDIAANYIASYFRQLGLQPAPGQADFFQQVQLQSITAATEARVQIDTANFNLKQSLLVMKGDNISWNGQLLYVGYGSKEEMTEEVRGKMVVALAGARDMENPMSVFSISDEKAERAQKLGAIGLIELVVTLPIPWPGLVNYFGNNTRTELNEGSSIPVVWIKSSENGVLEKLKSNTPVRGNLKINGVKKTLIPAKNVVGVLAGTDPKLKDEYLVISAHYDHVGVKKNKAGQDSIYNGARDNAIGTVGMMETARFLSAFPPKRSVVFIALTAEEKGMLGSQWYAEYPLIPLNKTVFNFNCDGAGYNDKTIVTVNGLEKTTAEQFLANACTAFGLKATLDPVPEQNLYERSDNISFARKGVPAINFAPGIKAFDQELMKYYHQPADEFGSLDMEYLTRYFRAYAYSNYLIANSAKAPYWKPGEKYETAAKELYKK